jgi:hypothetical protein
MADTQTFKMGDTPAHRDAHGALAFGAERQRGGYRPSRNVIRVSGGPAAAGDLAADVALAAGERVAAGVDLDLEPVTVLALPDHASLPSWRRFPGRKNDRE